VCVCVCVCVCNYISILYHFLDVNIFQNLKKSYNHENTPLGVVHHA